jgi:hypothetical protein
MGYSATRISASGLSTISLLKTEAGYFRGRTSQTDSTRETIIALQAGPGGAYGVIEHTVLATGESFRYALVIIVQRSKGEFAWKTLDEFAGPRITGMPASLLAKLTPIEELAVFGLEAHSLRYAEQWRRSATLEAARKEMLRTDGNIIVLDNPLTFSLNGAKELVRRFRVCREGRNLRFLALTDKGSSFGCKIRQSSLQMSDFSLELPPKDKSTVPA